MFIKCLLPLCLGIALIAIYFPTRHARRYTYVKDEDVMNELELGKPKTNLKNCNYEKHLVNGYEFNTQDVLYVKEYQQPAAGGQFSPKSCEALIKTAVIIPYRNRTEQLKTFLNYMHTFLQRQSIEYVIIVAEQNDALPFNRAKMLNYGAKLAISMNYDCLILQDVDLLPLNVGNIYGCSKKPRHMSCSLDIFRYNLPYLKLFGGAISIKSRQFLDVNGFSNNFYGWGGEDDDLYSRLEKNDLLPYRFSPKISKYVMLTHKKEKPSNNRFDIMKSSLDHYQLDGIKQLSSNLNKTLETLYTLIKVS